MKKAAGSLRVDLAQYREMEVFTQFSSDLDEMTRQQLTYGAGLMELLKQPLYHPLTMAEQVITLVAALNQAFLPIPKKEIKAAQAGLLAWFHQEQQPIVRELETGKRLPEELKYRIAQQVKVYFSTVLPTQQ
jgi:F-type H+-transporting ATPase subunit alpha